MLLLLVGFMFGVLIHAWLERKERKRILANMMPKPKCAYELERCLEDLLQQYEVWEPKWAPIWIAEYPERKNRKPTYTPSADDGRVYKRPTWRL